MMRMFSGFFCVFVYGFSCEYKATLAEIITYDHLQRKIMQSSSNTHTRTHTPSPIMSNRIWLLICLCCIWSRSEWWRKQVVRGGCVWIEHKCHWCCYRSILRWLGVFFYTFFFFFFFYKFYNSIFPWNHTKLLNLVRNSLVLQSIWKMKSKPLTCSLSQVAIHCIVNRTFTKST